MNYQEINKNNILIHKFMNEQFKQIDIDIDFTKYNENWNDLIPVIKTIESMDIYYKYINESSSQFSSSQFSAGKIEITTNINHVYQSVIDFIKWYNKQ